MLEDLRESHDFLVWEPVIKETMGNYARADLPLGFELTIEGSGVTGTEQICRLQTRAPDGRNNIVFVQESGETASEAVERTLHQASEELQEFKDIFGRDYEPERFALSEDE